MKNKNDELVFIKGKHHYEVPVTYSENSEYSKANVETFDFGVMRTGFPIQQLESVKDYIQYDESKGQIRIFVKTWKISLTNLY